MSCQHRFSSRTALRTKALFLFLACTLLSTPAAFAQAKREQVDGVKNFGRVTPTYFRGGAVTPEGVANLHRMGVRTIVDLRDKPSPGEPEACERLGIAYHKFSTDGHAAPDRATLDKILSIIKNAEDPVYVHCSAGKHRAGTVCALYRIEVQGWSREQAWAEQQAYGFGVPEEHPELYEFVYGKNAVAKAAGVTYVSERTPIERGDKADKKAKKSKDDDDDEDKGDDDDKKSKDDDDDKKSKDDDDDDKKSKDDDEGKDESENDSFDMTLNEVSDDSGAVAEAASEPAPSAERVAEATPASAVVGLSSAAGYIPMAKAIDRARAEGGSGQILKIDLEYDPIRSVTTWDVTFSSGAEYEIEATSGNVLATKQKAAAKLAVLQPLALDGSNFKTFQQIIAAAEKEHGSSVSEMELKRIKGRADTVFEVVLTDGSTYYYDAQSGAKASL
jgi:protein tyrosine phosphatase (PTP) superfamily phosphohydrolase (DUF442 family)